MPRGRLPTGILATTLSDAASMTVTLFERSFETYTSGSAAALAISVPNAASERSVSLIQFGAIALPPSRCEPAPAVGGGGAERVEVLPPHVRQHREGSALPRDVLTLSRAGYVERLPELMIPLAKGEGLALVAVEGMGRLHERHESGAIARPGPHHRLADQLERGPRRPGGLGERGAPATPEAAVQLAGAEPLELVVPADRPEPRRAVGREAESGLADPRDAVRGPALRDCPRHCGIHPAIVGSQQDDVGRGGVPDHRRAAARQATTRDRLDLGTPGRAVARHRPAGELALVHEELSEGIDVHRHTRRHVKQSPLAALVTQAVVRGADIEGRRAVGRHLEQRLAPARPHAPHDGQRAGPPESAAGLPAGPAG